MYLLPLNASAVFSQALLLMAPWPAAAHSSSHTESDFRRYRRYIESASATSRKLPQPNALTPRTSLSPAIPAATAHGPWPVWRPLFQSASACPHTLLQSAFRQRPCRLEYMSLRLAERAPSLRDAGAHRRGQEL